MNFNVLTKFCVLATIQSHWESFKVPHAINSVSCEITCILLNACVYSFPFYSTSDYEVSNQILTEVSRTN